MQRSDDQFATTRWSIVAAAGNASSATARLALAELCQTYWYPLYAFARRRGFAAQSAEDLTQGFFVHLLNADRVQLADRERGRFRSFLLKSLNSYIATEQRNRRTLKRGGNLLQVSIDYADGEQQYLTEPATHVTAEQLYERRWALTLLLNVQQQLRADYAERGQQELCTALEAHMNQDDDRATYAQVGRRLGMTEDAVKQAARRMKQRFRQLLRDEVAQTVRSEADVDDELQALLLAVSQR